MKQSERRVFRSLIAVASIVLTLSLGCKKVREPEGYRVVSFDAASHQWTIIRNGTFDGKYMTKRLVVVCMFYKWGEHETVDGTDACHLQVGRLIVPSLESGNADKNHFITVFEMPDETLSITEGSGDDRVMQQFKIVSYNVVTP
ncbi:MAG: hypothetical protein WBQ94_12240 [Terracidiphilus sp.]